MKTREYHKKWRADKEQRGLCISCGRTPQKATSKLCAPCTQKSIDNRARLSIARRAEGYCSQCLTKKPSGNFRLCDLCRKQKRKTGAARLLYRVSQYGLTIEDYEKLLIKQDNKCAICKSAPCGRWNQLDVDHCHTTGNVRGLLCHKCNRALGLLGDDLKLVVRAASYLRNAVSL